MVSFNSRISPRASTEIFFDRSPVATAVVTSAMLRTCVERLSASVLTLSVRSFHVPLTPLTFAWPPSLPSVPTSRATRVTSSANDESWSTMMLIVFLRARISPLTSTVIFFERSPFATAVVTSAMLRTCVVRLSASVLTLSVRSFHVPVTPFTGDAGDLVGERRELVDHDVDRVLEGEDLALGVDRDLLGEVAGRDGRRHLRDVAHLHGEVVRERVDVVRQVLPRARDTLHLRLAAQFALRADLARDARDLVGERRELVDHRVDGLLQLRDLAARVDGDLLGQVAGRDGRRHLRDVPHLVGQVVGDPVHGVREAAPRTADAFYFRLAA